MGRTNKIKKRLLAAVVIIAMLTSPFASFAAEQNGAGTAVAAAELGIPIHTAAELDAVRNNLAGQYYLANDIDLSNYGSWIPIGDRSAAFTGTFDGNGHKITNITIPSLSGRYYTGLFANVGSGGVVENLSVSVNISAITFSSGLFGAYTCVGAIAGYNAGTIQRCRAEGKVNSAATGGTGTQNTIQTGGLVGLNGGTIRQSCYEGNVDATVGYGGTTNVGGLVGNNSGIIEDCYETAAVYGNVTGALSVIRIGGLIGNNGGTVRRCYATGSVSLPAAASYNIGDLIGSGSDVVSCYYQDSGDPWGGNGTLLSAAQMKTQSSFVGWDFDSVWAISPTVNDGYPYLRGLYGGIPISTAAELDAVRNNLSGQYYLANDIDLSGYENWIPIGESSSVRFAGTFDGNGHKISNVTSTANRQISGLFGYVNGTVKNLSISVNISATFSGWSTNTTLYMGGIVAYNNGTIQQCHVEGNIRGTPNSYSINVDIGGIAGRNAGTISQCYAECEMRLTRLIDGDGGNIGGLAGYNSDVVEDCYSISSVSGVQSTFLTTLYIGGLVGRNARTIRRCYATGAVTRSGSGNTYYLGALVGNTSTSLRPVSSYFEDSAGNASDTGKGTPLSTALMKTQSSFVDWDFDSVWAISPTVNDGYPYLIGVYNGEGSEPPEPIKGFSAISEVIVSSNGVLRIKTDIFNGQDFQQDCYVILAAYDKDGRLITSVNAPLSLGISEGRSHVSELSGLQIDEDLTAKLFVWSDEFVPLVDEFVYILGNSVGNQLSIAGFEYEQIMRTGNFVKPVINNVNVTVLDKTKGIYRLEIFSDDYTVDSSASPFFFWRTKDGTFSNVSADLKSLVFTANSDIAGGLASVKVGLGDALGYIDEKYVALGGAANASLSATSNGAVNGVMAISDEPSFSDVGTKTWYHKFVTPMAKRNVVLGDANADTFRPEDTITIREFLTVVYRAACVNSVVYSDAMLEHAHNATREWINDEMYVSPNRAITREEAAYVLWKIFTSGDCNNMKHKLLEYDENGIKSGFKSVWQELTDKSNLSNQEYLNAVKQLTYNGVIEGYEDKAFRPINPITRGETCKIMCVTLLGSSSELYTDDDVDPIKLGTTEHKFDANKNGGQAYMVNITDPGYYTVAVTSGGANIEFNMFSNSKNLLSMSDPSKNEYVIMPSMIDPLYLYVPRPANASGNTEFIITINKQTTQYAAAADVKFKPITNGTYIYDNSIETIRKIHLANADAALFMETVCDGPNKQYVLSGAHNIDTKFNVEELIKPETEWIPNSMMEKVYFDIQFFAEDDTEIEFTSVGFDIHGGDAFIGTWAKYLGVPIFERPTDASSGIPHFGASFAPITETINNGSSLWLSDILSNFGQTYCEGINGNTIHWIMAFKVNSGNVKVRNVAMKAGENSAEDGRDTAISLSDAHSKFEAGNYNDYTMLMCEAEYIKGVANSLPQMETEMNYFINNSISGVLPVRIYNLGNSYLGTVLTGAWYSHNNPQYDKYHPVLSDESNLLPYTFEDNNLLNLYGKNVENPSNVWKIDTKHKRHNAYYDGNIPVYEPPANDANYLPNAPYEEAEQAGQRDGFGMANYGVTLRYKIKIYNDATQPKMFNYMIGGVQNIIVTGTINGITHRTESRGDYSHLAAGEEHPEVMFHAPLESGENEIVLEVILSTSNPGGLPNYFKIS